MSVQDVYQFENDAQIDAAHAAGAKNVLYVLPTGGGKSVVVRRRVRRHDAQGIKQVVIAHRQELVSQMSLHVAREGVQHAIIGPQPVIASITALHRKEFGRSFLNPSARCFVAGVDTLVSRKEALAPWAAQIGRWTIDEAHHVLAANKWGTAAAMFPNALGDGVSASPRRADGRGLGRWNDGLFDDMVVGPTMRQLIDMGALTEYQMCIPETDFDRDALKLTGSGDFSPGSMRDASEKAHLVGDVVVQYTKHAWGKQAIVFASDVKTSREMADRFNLFGIPAVSIDGTTDDLVRSKYVEDFRAGRLRVLVNVDLFGEGFDLPAIEVVIMARPTASLAVYLQQFGRALRLLEGKLFGLIIDMVSNFKQHGFPDKPHNWSLERREKRGKQEKDPEDIELTRCGNVEINPATGRYCMQPYDRSLPCCPHCGWKPVTTPGGGGVRELKQVDGDLTLLDVDVLNKMRADVELESPSAIGAKTSFLGSGISTLKANQQAEKIAAQRALQDALDLWAGHRVAAGDTTDQAYRRFFLTTGQSVLDVQHKDLTKADYDKTREMVLSWLNP